MANKKQAALDLADAVTPGEGKKRITPGTYPAIVSTSKIQQSKKGNDMLVLEFSVAEGEFAGEKLVKYNVLAGKGAGFTRETLLAFHAEDELQSGFVVNPINYLGKPCIISVVEDWYEHPEHTNAHRDDGKFETRKVDAVLAADDEAAQSAAQVTLNSEESETEDTPF